MKYKATSLAIFLLTAASGDSICSAFSTNRPLSTSQQIIHHQHTSSSASSSTSITTALHAKRRGKLINNVSLDDDGNVKLISNKQKQKLGSSKSKRNNKKHNEGASISPLLAEWATEGDDNDNASSSSSSSSNSAVFAPSKSDIFVPFDSDEDSSTKKKRKGNKKNRKSNNNDDRTGTGTKLSSTQLTSMNSILDDINEMIEKTNCDVSDIINQITSLVDLGSTFGGSNNQILLPTLKSILSYRPNPKDETDTQPSYRLAWVGSDTAICHIGTSLHKVPLARLQEMYLLLGYNNRWELLEVIRILGPFPNVRNTLKGEVTVKKNNASQKREGVRMEIAYQSMIDGTGKEILAGKDDNVKRVKLDIWFANEQALVCTTVPEDGDDDGDESEGGKGGDPLSGDGSNILLFVKEEDLDGNLEKLRAA